MFFLILFSPPPQILPILYARLNFCISIEMPFLGLFLLFFFKWLILLLCGGQRATFRSQFSPPPLCGFQGLNCLMGPLHLCSSLDLDIILPSSRLSFSHVAVFLGCDSFPSLSYHFSEIPFPVPYPTDSSCVFLYRALRKAMVLLAPSCTVTVGGQSLSCLIIVPIAHWTTGSATWRVCKKCLWLNYSPNSC